MDSALSSLGFSYTYDALGNIVEIQKNNQLYATYKYDALGQLKRENNAAANRTYVYEYDSQGNITARRTHYLEWNTATESLSSPISTDSYTYMSSSDGMWGDVLNNYNNSSFTYDAIGNPTSYHNGSAYTFSWSDGRKLTSGTKGSTSFLYSYNADGLRTKKTVNGVDYDYYWNGTRLEAMTVTQGQNTEKLLFYYNADGAPYALKYYDRAACLWRTFLYVTNLQGDVVALIDAGSGSAAATYEYDAWGRLVSESISPLPAHALLQYNPLTYRGYIYDEETGFYYLQTRYYDPTVGRFINADGQLNGGLLGYNQFAYCENNPVNRSDPTGDFFGWLIGGIVGAIGGAVSALVNKKSGKEFWGSVAGGAVSGAIEGLATDITVVTGGSGIVVGAALGFAGEFVGSIVDDAISGKDIDMESAVISGIEGAAFGAFFSFVSGPQKSMKQIAIDGAGTKRLQKGITLGYTVKKQVVREIKSIHKDFASDLLENFIEDYSVNACSWLFHG